jgi:hypothetical protein
MGHVFFRGWQLRAAVICVIAFVFAAVAATAEATTTTSSSGSTTCTTDPGGCTFSGNGSAAFAGHFDTPAIVLEPAQCLNQGVDGTDKLCGHFRIDTSSVQGTITVAIAFDPINDLDLCVIDSTGMVVGSCSTGSGATETVTFTVTCTDTHFEAQILPISYPFPGPTMLDPATYTGSVTTSLTSCGSGNGNGGGGNPPPPSVSGGHKFTGGGQLAIANVSNNIIQGSDTITYKGKVRFAMKSCDLRSTSIDSADWNDAAQQVTVHGHATVNGSGNYAFTVTLDDNGEPGNTDFENMQALCSGSGNLTSGNFQYHLPNA